MSGSVWNEGAAAARAGTSVTDCPYDRAHWDSVVWMNGWATAQHNMAVELQKAGLKFGNLEAGSMAVVVPRCSMCQLPQYRTPSGLTCDNGHGGADPAVTPVDDDLFGDDNSDLF